MRDVSNIPLFLFGNGLSMALSSEFSLKKITNKFIEGLNGDEKNFLVELSGGIDNLNFDDPSSDQVSDQDKTTLNARIIKEIQELSKVITEQERTSTDQVSDQDKMTFDTRLEELLELIKKVAELGEADEQLIAKYKESALAVTDEQLAILKYANSPQSNKDIQENALGLRTHTDNFKNHIEPLLKSGFIRRTIPNKPKSKLQKYYTTEKGRIVINIQEELLKN